MILAHERKEDCFQVHYVLMLSFCENLLIYTYLPALPSTRVGNTSIFDVIRLAKPGPLKLQNGKSGYVYLSVLFTELSTQKKPYEHNNNSI